MHKNDTLFYKMDTKVSNKRDTKQSNMKKALNEVWGEISDTEKKSFNEFFGFKGMKAAFLTKHTEYTKRKLDYTLSTGSVKKGMLDHIRDFIEDNKELIEAFRREEVDENQD